MIIKHNIPAMNAHRQMGLNTSTTAKSLEKLSSGFKINRSGDDAAGLAISEKMRGQIRGLGMAELNSNHGIKMIQTAEGGMEEIGNMLQRQRELLVQSLNGTYNDDDRAKLQAELDQLIGAIDGIANSTTFNNINLLNVSPFETIMKPPEPLNPENFLTHLTQLTSTPPPINADGTFNLNVTNTTETNESILIFGQGNTSNNLIQISDGNNTAVFDLTNASAVTLKSNTPYTAKDPGGERWETIYEIDAGGFKVEITQTLTIVDKPTEEASYYNFDYSITNNGTLPVTVDFLFNIDTQFTGTDGIPYDDPKFSINGQKSEILTGTVLSSGKLPDMVDLWHPENRNLNARAIISGSDIKEKPDDIFIGRWPSTQSFNYSGGETIGGDSEYSVVWRNKAVAVGGTLELNTMYGVTSPLQNPELVNVPDKLVQVPTTLYIHNGANKDEYMEVDRYDCRAKTLGVDPLLASPDDEANRSLTKVDVAINTLNTYRANCGAQNNRLEHSIGNLGTGKENLQVAESSIRDLDMANQMMLFTKDNILVQSSQSMLAQANQLTQGVLELLK